MKNNNAPDNPNPQFAHNMFIDDANHVLTKGIDDPTNTIGGAG